MRYFDLHCDTITEAFAQGQHLQTNGLQVSFAHAAVLERYCQLFAVFIPDTLRGQDAFDYFQRVADFFYQEIAACPAVSLWCPDAQSASPIQVILSVEGGSACGGTIDGIYALRERGVAVMTLTWNGSNELAGGAFSDPDCGLTDFGREALRAMAACGIIPDISHLGKRSFSQLVDAYDGVFIASHSNYDLTDNRYGKARNLSASQVRELIVRKGLLGLNFCPDFLGDNGNTGFEAVLRHIDAFLTLGAEDILAFGSDFDGCQPDPVLRGIDKVPALYDYLHSGGLPKTLLDKIFWGNAASFFTKQLTGLYENSDIQTG